MITRLQPIISTTGIRRILDNEGREIATINSLLDGIDNKARADEAEYIHNAICDSFNAATALRAENARLREALQSIAAGYGVYGQQAAEYKDIARRALESSNGN